MKVIEFVELLKKCNEYFDCSNWPLVVSTEDNSIGPSSFVSIKAVIPGFDWDHGKMQILTDPKIVKVKAKRKTLTKGK